MRRVMVGCLMAILTASAAEAQTGKRLALGAGLNLHHYEDGNFGSKNPGVAFVYRFSPHPSNTDGWSWTLKTSFSYANTSTESEIGGVDTKLGSLRTIPLLVGLQRGHRQGPMKLGAWVVAGPSLNHFSIDGAARSAYQTRLGSTLETINVKNSLAVKPGISAWYDLGSWIGLHGSVSYTFNRPTAETTIDGAKTSSTWKTDHGSVDLGLVVGIF